MDVLGHLVSVVCIGSLGFSSGCDLLFGVQQWGCCIIRVSAVGVLDQLGLAVSVLGYD